MLLIVPKVSELDPTNALITIARKAVGFGRRQLFGEACAFLTYAQIIKARLDHLASLNLDISEKSVLEVGAGIGLLTGFFEDRGCSILSLKGTGQRKRDQEEVSVAKSRISGP